MARKVNDNEALFLDLQLTNILSCRKLAGGAEYLSVRHENAKTKAKAKAKI